MPALLIRKCTPPSRCLVSSDEAVDRIAVAHVAPHGEDADPHGGERGLGEQGLLAHVPAGHVHEAEGDVAAELAELHGDVPAEPGGAAGHDGHLAPPAGAGRLWLRLFERGATAFRRLEIPTTGGGRTRRMARAWASKVRRARREGKASSDPSPCATAAVNWSLCFAALPGCWSRSPAPPAGACWPSTGARPSAPPGSSWPPSAPTSSPSASTAASSPTGSSASTTAGPRRPSGSPTAATSSRPPAGCCSATTSPPSPAPGPLVGPVLAAQFGYLPGHHLDRLRRRAGGRGAGLRHPVRLDAAGRQVARADGQGGDRPGHRPARDGRGARDHGDPARPCSRWSW